MKYGGEIEGRQGEKQGGEKVECEGETRLLEIRQGTENVSHA